MAAVGDLIQQLSATTGTGNFTLTSVNGCRDFSAEFGTGSTTDVFNYFISNRDAAEWEKGTGHLSASNTLVRDTVIASSNANALVNFSAGTKDVICDLFAQTQFLVPSFAAAADQGILTNPFFEISQQRGTALQSNFGTGLVYAADQWFCYEDDATAVGSIQNVTSPFSGVSNYKRLQNSLKAIVTTAQGSWGAGSTSFTPLIQRIEGTFFQHLGFGTADARGIQVLMVAVAAVAGTYTFALRNFAGNRSYVTSFALTTSPTVVLLTIPGDTGGTWVTGTAGAAVINVGTVGGTGTQASSLNTWTATGATSHSSATNYASSTSNYVQVGCLQMFPQGHLPFTQASQITGEALQRVFDMRRSFDTELRRCERYFQTNFPIGTVPGDNTIGGRLGIGMGGGTSILLFPIIHFRTRMRTGPTLTPYSSSVKASPSAGQWQYYDGAWKDSATFTSLEATDELYGAYGSVTGGTNLGAFVVAGGWAADARL